MTCKIKINWSSLESFRKLWNINKPQLTPTWRFSRFINNLIRNIFCRFSREAYNLYLELTCLSNTRNFQIANIFCIGIYRGHTFSHIMWPFTADPYHQLHFINTHSPTHSVTCSANTHDQWDVQQNQRLFTQHTNFFSLYHICPLFNVLLPGYLSSKMCQIATIH